LIKKSSISPSLSSLYFQIPFTILPALIQKTLELWYEHGSQSRSNLRNWLANEATKDLLEKLKTDVEFEPSRRMHDNGN
jgi:hypothetical protein